MGWTGGGDTGPTEAENASAESAVADWYDYKENYQPLVGEYLKDNEATTSELRKARGIGVTDAAVGGSQGNINAISGGASRGIGGGGRVVGAVLDNTNDRADARTRNANAADFTRNRQELASKMKVASLGRNIASDVQAARNNSVTSQTNSAISDMENRVNRNNYVAEGLGQGAGMYYQVKNREDTK